MERWRARRRANVPPAAARSAARPRSDDAAALEDQHLVEGLEARRGGGVTSSVARPSPARTISRITSRSVSASRCAVGSSRRRKGASRSSARARARRCRSPPESCWPCSPIQVSSPSGRRATRSSRRAAARAARSCASLGARGGEDEVLAQRPGEEVRALGGEGDRAAHAVGGPRPRVAPVEEEAPRGDVPEAQEQVDEGGLAGAARAHDGDAPARLEAEAHAVERGAGLAGVGEAQVAHLEDPRRVGRSGRAPAGSTTAGGWSVSLEEPARRLAHERPAPCHAAGRAATASNAARVRSVTTARWTPSSVLRAHGGDREGEHGDRGQVGAETRERAAERGGADEALLLAHGLRG